MLFRIGNDLSGFNDDLDGNDGVPSSSSRRTVRDHRGRSGGRGVFSHHQTDSTKERKVRRKPLKTRFTSYLPPAIAPLICLFELPGLTERWYVRSVNGFIVATHPDPPLLTIGLSISLFCAVLANILLLFRLLGSQERWTTLISLIFLFIHFVINLVALVVFAVHNSESLAGYTLSTAFWLTASSTVLGTFISVLMIMDGMQTGWGKRREEGTGVSAKQRSLNVAITFFLSFIMVGTIAFRYLIDDLSFLDSLYFVIQSVLTTGFGDIVPNTTLSRVFSMFYNGIGIILFAIVIVFVRITVLESMESAFRMREESVLKGLKQRRLRLRERLTHSVSYLGVTLSRRPSSPGESRDGWSCFGWRREENRRVTIDQVVVQHAESPVIVRDDKVSEERKVPRILIHDPVCVPREETGEDHESNTDDEEDSYNEEDEEGYEAAIVSMRNDRKKEVRSQILVSTSLSLFLWIFGAVVFWRLEPRWTYFTALYFSFTSLSTVGYGDLYPTTPASRGFFCAWALAGAGALTILFTVLADAYSGRFTKTFKRSFVGKVLDTWALTAKLTPKLEQESQPDPGGFSREERTTSSHIAAPSNSPVSPDGTLVATTSSPLASHSQQIVIHASTQNELGQTLVDLIRDMKLHVQALMESNSFEGSRVVRNEVRELMDEKSFAVSNREAVEGQDNLMRFLYLRRMRTRLSQLDTKATKAIVKLRHSSETAYDHTASNVTGSDAKEMLAPHEDGAKEARECDDDIAADIAVVEEDDSHNRRRGND